MSTSDVFYASLEGGVREAVRALRNAGINTFCSCHHAGWIQCESSDPTTERLRIWNVMYELGIKEWRATLYVSSSEGHRDYWQIESTQLEAERTK